mmetsp:Transcript_51806/g.143466  ORF Transcript_51806/g.143466 Transcript_51806/m.143466 type:complete len:227 (-) Transcript_51806:418-1098(-)
MGTADACVVLVRCGARLRPPSLSLPKKVRHRHGARATTKALIKMKGTSISIWTNSPMALHRFSIPLVFVSRITASRLLVRHPESSTIKKSGTKIRSTSSEPNCTQVADTFLKLNSASSSYSLFAFSIFWHSLRVRSPVHITIAYGMKVIASSKPSNAWANQRPRVSSSPGLLPERRSMGSAAQHGHSVAKSQAPPWRRSPRTRAGQRHGIARYSRRNMNGTRSSST